MATVALLGALSTSRPRPPSSLEKFPDSRCATPQPSRFLHGSSQALPSLSPVPGMSSPSQFSSMFKQFPLLAFTLALLFVRSKSDPARLRIFSIRSPFTRWLRVIQQGFEHQAALHQQLNFRGFDDIETLSGGDDQWQNWSSKIRTAETLRLGPPVPCVFHRGQAKCLRADSSCTETSQRKWSGKYLWYGEVILQERAGSYSGLK